MTNHSQPDDSINKALAALRDAAPPKGLEERITARLAAAQGFSPGSQPAPTPSFASRWRDPLLAPAWWRGAFTGAAAAAIAFALFLAGSHFFRTRPAAPIAANHPAEPARPSAPVVVPTSSPAATPCAHPTILRINTNPEPSAPALLVATNAPSRPAPKLGLTPQERELLQLAHTANPKDLAPLTEAQARADAEEHADLARFFAPAPPPTSESTPAPNPASNSTPNTQSTPAENPEASPATSPEGAPPPTFERNPPEDAPPAAE